MKTVVVTWKQSIREESTRAIEMSQWCKTAGLVHNTDYVWRLDTENNQTEFTFNDHRESMSTMFALLWSQ